MEMGDGEGEGRGQWKEGHPEGRSAKLTAQSWEHSAGLGWSLGVQVHWGSGKSGWKSRWVQFENKEGNDVIRNLAMHQALWQRARRLGLILSESPLPLSRSSCLGTLFITVCWMNNIRMFLQALPLNKTNTKWHSHILQHFGEDMQK